ncbi:MAG: ATP-dependent helicase, partial [Opitutales bacterium]|nr:ATP-dependent helicase [Opitutales bacterium]
MNGRTGGIDFEGELNAEQYAAVSAPRGPALVLAGAGSGKTRTLTYRVAWLRAKGYKPWEILLLTFTNKAAREMIERVGHLTGEDKAVEWGGTFHSVGARMLRKIGASVGLKPDYTIMDEGDAESLFKEVASGVSKSFFRDKENPKPKVLQDWLSYARNTCMSVTDVVKERRAEGWEDIAESLERFATAYQEKKLASQVVDYDDLQTLCLEALRKDEYSLNYYRNKFKNILVDEYQDTNAVQSQLIDLLAHEHQVMAVGDDAQCIYTWRGAEFDNILHFADRHPGAKIYQILSNYRSTQPILNFANDVLRMQAQLGSGYEKELRAVRKGNLKPRVVPCADTVSQARFVINRVQGLIDEGHSLGEIAILYRAHYQALDLQMELSRNAVPFTITSGIRFFEQAHIRDLVAQLRIIVNPDDEPAFLRICQLLPKIGPKTATRIFAAIRATFNKRRQNAEAATRTTHTLELFADHAPKTDKLAVEQTHASHPIELFNAKEVLEKVPEAARETWRDFADTLSDALERFRTQPEKPARVVQILADGWYGDYLKNAYDRPENRRDDLDALSAFAEQYKDMGEMLAQLVLLSSES